MKENNYFQSVISKQKIFILKKFFWKAVSFLIGMIVGVSVLIWIFLILLGMSDVSKIDTILKDYVMIALTLFGFTLIGGIFEKKHEKKLYPVTTELFRSSMIFLFSTVCFLLASSSFNAQNRFQWGHDIYILSFLFGAIAFVLGIVNSIFII